MRYNIDLMEQMVVYAADLPLENFTKEQICSHFRETDYDKRTVEYNFSLLEDKDFVKLLRDGDNYRLTAQGQDFVKKIESNQHKDSILKSFWKKQKNNLLSIFG